MKDSPAMINQRIVAIEDAIRAMREQVNQFKGRLEVTEFDRDNYDYLGTLSANAFCLCRVAEAFHHSVENALSKLRS